MFGLLKDKWNLVTLVFLLGTLGVIYFKGNPLLQRSTSNIASIMALSADELKQKEKDIARLDSIIALDSLHKNVVVYLGKVSGSCESGYLMRKILSLEKKHPQELFHILLDDDYTETDLENFKKNYDLDFKFRTVSTEELPVLAHFAPQEIKADALSGLILVIDGQTNLRYSNIVFSNDKEALSAIEIILTAF